jgi:glutamate-ammonia-ligase adenylyltransferase
MRRKMEPKVLRRGRMMTDIKTGAGGMVDVEFIVQMIQMKIGASRPSVRGLKILPMLRSPDASPLRGDEGGMLAAAYTMYRRIEFLMRVTLEERGYALPEGEKLDSLARLYDGSSGGALAARVATAMKYVRTVFLDVVTRVA